MDEGVNKCRPAASIWPISTFTHLIAAFSPVVGISEAETDGAFEWLSRLSDSPSASEFQKPLYQPKKTVGPISTEPVIGR